jgi:hypothetical protein
MVLNLVVHGRRPVAPRQRHHQESGWLVHDQERFVFIQDFELAGFSWSKARSRRPGTIRPDPHAVPGFEPDGGVLRRGFTIVQENFSPLNGRRGASPRTQPHLGREEFIEAYAGSALVDSPRLSRPVGSSHVVVLPPLDWMLTVGLESSNLLSH